MQPSLTHCALHVQDIEASVSFYERYCGMQVVREHGRSAQERTVWIAEPGRETEFVLVLVSGGSPQQRTKGDMTHLGFSVSTREDVDCIAALAKQDGILHWEAQELPFPVGYLCAVTDPDGYVVEFSHGQPLGSEERDAS